MNDSEEATGSGTPAPEPEKKALSPQQWAEIRDAVAMGVMRASDCARKYGISNAAISKHLNSHGIKFESKKKQIEAAAEKKLIEKTAETFAERKHKLISETKEQGYNAAVFIQRLVLKTLSDNMNAGSAPSIVANDMKALRTAAVTLQSTLEQRWKVLDADKEINPDELPEIKIIDLTEEEIRGLQQTSEDADLIDAPLPALDEGTDEIVLEDDEDNGTS